MSRGNALLASSLAICSASWAIGTDIHPVYSEEMMQNSEPTWDKGQLAQDALYQYLNPITVVADGNLAAQIESKPIIYTVKKGDTLSEICSSYEIDYDDLMRCNHIEDPDLLLVGQSITMPMTRKWIRVDTEDTLESLAKEYTTSIPLLMFLNPTLEQTQTAYVGQLLAVPQKKVSVPTDQAMLAKDRPTKKTVTREKRPRVYIKQPGGFGVFQWPVYGEITSNFGWRHGRQHKGIDIWNSSTSSTIIRSSLGGTVVRAGYAGAYGNLVVIEHPGGWETYYAHLSRISVSKGAQIDTGQMVGYMGQTGDATGYHLHFEVRKDGQAFNPLVVLKR